MLHKDELEYLQQAINLAYMALEDGNSPFAAVIVKDNQILAAARNRTVTEHNPTLHAEIVAIQEACREHGVKAVAGSTIFCSCEPCPMCLSAIYYTELPKIVYAATLADAIRFNSGDPPLTAEWLNEHGHLNLQIVATEGRERVVSLFEQYVHKFGHL